jgi:hypothetical protein
MYILQSEFRNEDIFCFGYPGDLVTLSTSSHGDKAQALLPPLSLCRAGLQTFQSTARSARDMSHHYAFVAAKLAEQCLEQIQHVIDTDERSKRLHPSNSSLYDMKEALTEIERQLYIYFVYIIQKEVENSTSAQVHQEYNAHTLSDLPSCVNFLRALLQEASLSAVDHAAHRTHSFYPRRSATDSLLFRLNVALQLCLVRIDDARLVICGRRRDKTSTASSTTSSLVPVTRMSSSGTSMLYMAAGMLGATSLTLWSWHRRSSVWATGRSLAVVRHGGAVRSIIQAGIVLQLSSWLHYKWSNMWMTNKIVKSTEALEEWSRQWTLIQCTPAPPPLRPHNAASTLPNQALCGLPDSSSVDAEKCSADSLIDAAKSQRLIQYALHETTKVNRYLASRIRFVHTLIAHARHARCHCSDVILALPRRAAILDAQASHGCLLRVRRNRHGLDGDSGK